MFAKAKSAEETSGVISRQIRSKAVFLKFGVCAITSPAKRRDNSATGAFFLFFEGFSEVTEGFSGFVSETSFVVPQELKIARKSITVITE